MIDRIDVGNIATDDGGDEIAATLQRTRRTSGDLEGAIERLRKEKSEDVRVSFVAKSESQRLLQV